MTATTSHLLPNGQDLDTARAEAARAYELDREHVFHSWSAQAQIKPMTIVASEGSYVWDGDGTRLLDFSGQLVFTNIGHQHPKVVAAIAEQAAKLCTVAPQHANAARSEAARLIAERTPGDLNRVFFTNGGADAVEHAVRMARLHTGRRKVLSRYRSYHGGTDTAINLTGDPRRYPNDYGSAGVVHFNGPFLYRSSFYAENEQQESERALDYLERLIAHEGPATIAAIILESVPGTAGIMVPPPGYLAGVREICDRHGIVFIADEVMAGFGRTGKWFAIDHFDVVPDLMTFAKGVTSGYVPLGGVAINDAIYCDVRRPRLPGRADLLRTPAGLRGRGRDHQRDGRRGHGRQRRPARRAGARPGTARAGAAPPLGRRGARARRVLGHRTRRQPGDPGTVGALRQFQRRR